MKQIPSRILLLLCALALWLPARAGFAHPLLQGSLTVVVEQDQVNIRARVMQEEVTVTNGLTTPNAPPGPWAAASFSDYQQHAAYLSAHIHVFADGVELPAGVSTVTPPDDPKAKTASATYDLLYPILRKTGKPSKIEIKQDVMGEIHFAPGAKWETTYVVSIHVAGGPPTEALLLTADRPISFNCDAAAEASSPVHKSQLFREYFIHGVHHILTGYDHLLFISALVLAATTLWDLVKVVTAFTLAHTLTLTLAALNLVHLPERVVELLISLSIVFVAMQNVFWPKQSRGWTRLAAAFFFGLFHGLGFAGGLLEAMQGMHGSTVFLAIIAFSIGVEVGHQFIVIPLFSVLKIIRHTRENPIAKERFSLLAQRLGSAAISVAGLVYLFLALKPSFLNGG